MKKVLLIAVSMLLLTAGMAMAANVEITGDYRFRYDKLEGTTATYYQITNPFASPPGVAGAATPESKVKNNSLMTNRFGLNIKAEALEDVRVKARLVMFKVWGHSTASPYLGSYFGDRSDMFGVYDGVSTHVPQDNTVRVDYAYATMSNVFDTPTWISIGRRPSTGGVPGNIRQNREKIGSAGIPNIMVDYAFDGFSLGWAPDIEALPGFYTKFCGGRGYESGYNGATADTDFYGLNAVLYNEDAFYLELQYQTGRHIFDIPSDGTILYQAGTATPISVAADLGDIDWFGGVVTSKLSNLTLFLSGAASSTSPTSSTWQNVGNAGMLWDGLGGPEKHTGSAWYIGGRFDMGSTKIGAEYNYGSKYWIGMVPAADDVWTSKLGTRGTVAEVYLIQELKRAKVSKKGRSFIRLGYQYYDFEYTGSNNWVGAPRKIDDLNNAANAQMLTPIKDASDLYLTWDVEF